MGTFNPLDWSITQEVTESGGTKWILTGWIGGGSGDPQDIYIPAIYNGGQISLNDLKIFPTDMETLQVEANGDQLVGLEATDLTSSFEGKNSIMTIDLNGLDTKSVTNMSKMFAGCGVRELNLNFNTSAVTDMPAMFSTCENLEKITFSKNFKTGQVSNMMMFKGCQALRVLDLHTFDLKEIKTYSQMFSTMPALEIVDFPECPVDVMDGTTGSSDNPFILLTTTDGFTDETFSSTRKLSQATFDANGGKILTGESERTISFHYVYENHEALKADLLQAQSQLPKPAGYQFKKWERVPVSEDALEDLLNQANATYTAVWRKLPSARNCHHR